ncbi:hypothetical protein TRVA0_033S01024 [Trichomonascus vanleenenianus]|uniref:uncharacterized protein n=1 Tax=Trichomonascus vanleenenianus TaxID=2268995 RepID=UPI003EC9AA92
MASGDYSRLEGELPLVSNESLQSLVSSSPSSRDSISSRGLSESSTPRFGENDDYEEEHLRPVGHHRSLSVSTLGDHMFNLATSREFMDDQGIPLEKQKRLTLMHGLSLVIGLQIGSGIFASPNQINSHAGSIGASLAIWVVSGLLAWTGASSFAELGCAIPLNGSSQAYLNQIFGSLPSFLFSWTALTVLKPGSAAIISIIFGEYFAKSLGAEFLSSFWMKKLFAILALVLVSALNCYSSRSGAHASNVFMVTKISILLAISIIGFVALPRFTKDNAISGTNIFEGSSKSFGDYAVALYAGLWAYDGWDNMNYVAAEMKNSSRDIPRVIHMSMPLVILAYVLANISYFCVLSKEEVLETTTVALSFAKKVFGTPGAVIFALLISFSCIGALNATLFSSARLVYSSAEQGYLPKIFSKIDEKRNTPINAIILQASMTALFIIIGEFHTLVTFYGVSGYVFYFMTVLGVIVLRVKEPDLYRPYKTYITTPIIFCCVALFLVSRGIFEKPVEAICAFLFIGAGLPIYIYKFGMPVNVEMFKDSVSAIAQKFRKT